MPKVLLIDDDPHLRKILSNVLHKKGYDVVIAEDGASGLRVAKRQRPDLIILDIIMPGMDGFQVAQRLHEDPTTARIPIMVLTAYATPYGRKAAVDVGVDDFVTKPFGIEDLVAKVQALTSAHGMVHNALTLPLKTSRQARIIAVHSLSGGLGSTSLSVNLASSLYRLWFWPTMLLDADFANGQIALMLDSYDALSWSELMQASLDNSAQQLLEERRQAQEEGLHVMTAPRDARDAERVSPQFVSNSLRLLEQPYDYLVADLAHDLRDNTLELLRNADKILLLLSSDSVSLRLARRALAAYRTRGIRPEDVLPVMVSTRPGETAKVRQVELAIGHTLAAYIPYVPELTDAVNKGLPFSELFPNHLASQLVEDLAYLLSKPAHKQAEREIPSPLYGRVLARVTAAGQDTATDELGTYLLRQAGLES
jgi:CheY-like chemotaxis protein/MinD-like ATPase involved in chromosome partitioning or flagellar assembly